MNQANPNELGQNWFERHLFGTAVLYNLVYIPLSFIVYYNEHWGIVIIIFYLIGGLLVGAWILEKLERSLWYLLLNVIPYAFGIVLIILLIIDHDSARHRRTSSAQTTNVRYCRQCGYGYWLSKNYSFCPECGAEIIKTDDSTAIEPESSQPVCDNCGKEVDIDQKFCPHCGQKIPERLVEEAQEEDEAEHLTCSNCESPILIDDKYCFSCGANLEEDTSTQMPDASEGCPSCGHLNYYRELVNRDKSIYSCYCENCENDWLAKWTTKLEGNKPQSPLEYVKIGIATHGADILVDANKECPYCLSKSITKRHVFGSYFDNTRMKTGHGASYCSCKQCEKKWFSVNQNSEELPLEELHSDGFI